MISPYGILISLSILTALLLLEWIIKRENKNPEVVWSGSIFVIISGIIGARLYHVLHFWDLYSKDPVSILAVWNGGLGIYGALIFGLLAVVIYIKIKKLDLLFWVDSIGIVLPLAQAIGRLGNMINFENMGTPTQLPWGVSPNFPENLEIPTEQITKLHPVPVYESLLNIILFLVLFYTYKKDQYKMGSGTYITTYFIGYAVVRYFLEFIRIGTWEYQTLNVAQFVSILIISISIYFAVKNENIFSK